MKKLGRTRKAASNFFSLRVHCIEIIHSYQSLIVMYYLGGGVV